MCTGLANDLDCPASAASAIAAAFHTQGYFVQADIIYQLGETGFGTWAPLLYIIAFISAIIMMAMGQPPRTYIWLILGPAIFNWCLFKTTPVKGVAWNLAGVAQNQEIVWKLAEVGLLNTNIVQTNGAISATDNTNKWHGDDKWGSNGAVSVSSKSAPSSSVNVSYLYLLFDSLISEQVQSITKWTGIYSQKHNGTGGNSLTPQEPNNGATAIDGKDTAWHILSNSKWPLLENITSATLHNADLRDSFTMFMSSECGDVISKLIDKSAYISASQAKGRTLPNSVFRLSDPSLGWWMGIPTITTGGNILKKNLESTNIPTPKPLIDLLKTHPGDVDKNFKTFLRQAVGEEEADKVNDVGKESHLSCWRYLYIIIQGFRWETGLSYNQIIREAADHKIKEDDIAFNFLYGWAFADANGEVRNNLTTDEQKSYIKDLILLHLMRNELAFAQAPVNERWTSSEKSGDYVEAYQRSIGSKSKYGELYTWAKMMPYVQGTLLYFLTIAYPFCCIVMIIPGWWKTIFTWMAFMAWAKSWDVGFAVVMVLERSIWAMVGNHADAAAINKLVLSMKDLGVVKVDCRGGLLGLYNTQLGCPIPVVSTEAQNASKILKTFDLGLLMSGNLDLDLANSYYIYLMSALYFAVPAVTGQVLLGAKAGASSLATNLLGQNPQTIGNAASNAAIGEVTTRSNNAMSIVDQTAQAKSLRSGGGAEFLNKSFGAQNSGLLRGAQRELNSATASRIGDAVNMRETETASRRNAISTANSLLGGIIGTGEAYYKAGQPQGAGGNGGQGGGANANGAANSRNGEFSNRNGLYGSTSSALSGMNNFTGSAADARAYNQFGEVRAQGIRRTAELGNQSAELGMLQSADNTMGGRYQAAMQQQAGEDGWRAKRNFAMQMTGKGSAMGVFTGNYSAGPKPISAEGMAGLGMLGSNPYELFNYPINGYKSAVDKGMSELNGEFGKDSNHYKFTPATLYDGIKEKGKGAYAMHSGDNGQWGDSNAMTSTDYAANATAYGAIQGAYPMVRAAGQQLSTAGGLVANSPLGQWGGSIISNVGSRFGPVGDALSTFSNSTAGQFLKTGAAVAPVAVAANQLGKDSERDKAAANTPSLEKK